MNTVLDELAITEAIFNIVMAKDTYSLQVIHDALCEKGFVGISDAEVREGIKTLVNASDLYKFDEEKDLLTTQKGYIPLNIQRIESALPLACSGNILVHQRFVTGSTNTDLEKISLKNTPSVAGVAVAEMQTGGRGRRAKKWVSPLAKNLYFSFKYHFPQAALPYLSALSLRAGIALLDSLRALGIENAKLKWPNDIWVEGQKLAGILVESVVTQSGIEVIIGIGVNNQHDRSLDIVGNNPSCCEAVLGAPLDRNILVATLASKLYSLCCQINEAPESLKDLMIDWPLNSCFYGHIVRLSSDKEEIIGEEIGVDTSGALMIRLASGEVRALYSGDLSLRAFAE